MRTIKLIINIVLAVGCFLVFNESDSFTPNFVGLACFVALLYINRNNHDTITEQ